MTDNNKTLIVVVLDRSGSMQSIKSDMEGGFARFMEEQAALPGTCEVSLYQFDDHYDVMFERRPAKEVTHIELEPRGYTALFDALGRTIDTVGRQLRAMPEHKRPGAVIVIVITDGQENASKEYSGAKVKEMIQRQTDRYNWRFAYLGAHADTFSAAGHLGIAFDSTAKYAANSAGVHGMYASASAGVGAYRGLVSRGVVGATLNVNPAQGTVVQCDDCGQYGHQGCKAADGLFGKLEDKT